MSNELIAPSNELIAAKHEITRVLGEGDIIETTTSSDPIGGYAYHIEITQVVGSEMADAYAICQKYFVVMRLTGKGKHALVTVSEN